MILAADLVYAAGLADGEAYIGIKKDLGSQRRGHSISPLYHERIQVKMSRREGLDVLAQLFGGTVRRDKQPYIYRTSFKTNHALWNWNVLDRTAGEAVRALFPYLRVKKEEAALVIKLWESKRSPLAASRRLVKGRAMDPKLLEERENLYRAVRAIHGHPVDGEVLG